MANPIFNEETVIRATEMLLTGLGLGLNDPNFKDTPARVMRSYRETCSGLYNLEQEIENILKTTFPSEGYNGMIVETGIVVHSLCPHHLLPVSYNIDIGYIPSKDKKVLGASKLSRSADILGRRPILQESFTTDILKCFEQVSAEGVAVIISGKHQCMRCRGIRQKDSMLHTSLMTGAFEINASTRQEFFHLVERGNR